MFKTAAAKLAHNSTIPALARNSDLKPLQEVITTEKLVLQSLQRLSTDLGKSTEALRAWANGEGEDLGDTFSACSNLLNHWVSSLASFASHIAHIRECLKAVRTREEGLDDMNRRRKSLVSKADSADKKLSKMGPEGKNTRQQTDLLMGLREQIRTLDVEIMNEEAALGDWKRAKAREWMGVMFGALLECSEKGKVVATFGRTIIGYVPTEKTQPGLPRAHYTGHSEVEPLVVEAEREIHKISFMSEVGDWAQQPPNQYLIGDIPGLPPSSPSSPVRPTPTQPYASSTLPNHASGNPHELNEFGEYSPHPQFQTYAPGQRPRLSSFDQPPAPSPTRSSPFLSHPPQGSSGFTPGHLPHRSQGSLHSGSGLAPSYPQHNIAPALHLTQPSNNASVSGMIPERRTTAEDTFSSSIAKALGESWGIDEKRKTNPPRLSTDGPPPSYAINNFSTPSPSDPQAPSRVERKPVPTHIQEVSNEEDDGVGLPYLNPSTEDSASHRSEEKRLSDSGNGPRDERKVRWGSVRDVDAELEKRYSEEIRKSHEMRRSVSPGRGPQPPSPMYRSRSPSPPMPDPHQRVLQQAEVHPTESPTSTEGLHPLPNPNVSVEDEGQGPLDERSLNVLAAQEISKQIGMSGSPLSPPSLPFGGRKSASPRSSFTTDIPPSNDNNRFGQSLSSPLPPLPQSRDVSPILDARQVPQLQPPPPPIGAWPHSTSVDSVVSDPTQVDDAYHTPPEYLRNLSTPPSPPMNPASPLQVQVGQFSPILPSPSTPTTTKKISAAAFRRPGMKGPSNTSNVRGDSLRQDSLGVGFRPNAGRSLSLERNEDENVAGFPESNVTPLNLRKKSLPPAPGPPTSVLSGPREQRGPRSVSSPFPNLGTSEQQMQGRGRMAGLSNSPESRPRDSAVGGEDEFDYYVSAYLDEDERRESAIHNGATNGYDQNGGGPGAGSQQGEGYGSGRFATRLDG